MKLYEFAAFPNPRRVRWFMAEKGVSFESVTVNVLEGEHRGEAFLKINPFAAVPVLELDDGTQISETQAICRYVEGIHPEGPLFGGSAKQQGIVEMWQRRIELGLFDRIAVYFHNATPGLGELELYQNKGYGEYSLERALATMEHIEKALEGQQYIAGDFSVADITGICAIDFAAFCKVEVPAHLTNVKAWYERVSARPAAKA